MAKDTKNKKDGGLLNRLRSARQQKVDPELKELLDEVQADPSNMRVRRKLADYYLKKEDRVAALDQYLTVAETYAEKGFYPKAVAVYKQALQIDPKMIEVYLKLASLYHKLGLMPEVVQQYQKAAAIYEEQGKEREALDIRRMLLDLDPTNLIGRVKLGQRYLEKGFKQEAVHEFLQAADILEQQGKTAELQKLLEGAIDRGLETFDLLYRLVQLFRTQGRPDLALARLAKLTGELAGSSSTLELTAELAVELGKPAIAVKALERVGDLYSQINRQDKVGEVAKRILSIDPQNAYALAHAAPAKVEAPPAPPVAEARIPLVPVAEEVEGEITIEEETPVSYIAEPTEHEAKPAAVAEEKIEFIAEGTAHEIEEIPLDEEIVIEEEAAAPVPAAPEVEEIPMVEEIPVAAAEPVAEVPVEEIVVEEIPVEEISLEEVPAEEIVVEEVVIEETPVEEIAFEEVAAEPVAEAVVSEPAEVPIEEVSFETEVAEEPAAEEETLDLGAMSEDEIAQRLDEATDIYLKYNLRDKAIEYLSRALERNPNSMPVVEKMMIVYRDGGDLAKAGELLEQLVDLSQAEGRRDKLEQYLSLMVEQSPDDLAAAVKLAEHYAATEPERAIIHYLELVNRHRDADRLGDAEKMLERVLAIDPTNEAAQQELLEIYEQSGQIEKAVEKLYFLHDRARDYNDVHGAEGVFQIGRAHV